MYRLFAVDLDETLLDSEKRISDENLRSIESAKRQGCRIVICSGRAPAAIRGYIDQIGSWDASDLYIALNGCMMIQAAGHKALETCYFPREQASLFIEIARRNASMLNIQLYREDEYYVERRDETTDIYEFRTGTSARMIEDISSVADDKMLKLVMLTNSHEGIQKVCDQIVPYLPAEVKGFFSSSRTTPFLFELVSASVDKGVAVEQAAARFAIPMEDVICIGDSYNDIPMIQRAGLGITVANAEQAVKDTADYITEKTNNENAVAEALRKFILIQ